MQTTTTPPDEPEAGGDGTVVEREVESVRTRERVAGAPTDATQARGCRAG